jgi:hypothetical protein
MPTMQKSRRVPARGDERRRFQRARVNLRGSYMLADRHEYPCQVEDMSPGGMLVVAPVCGKAGERVIAYVDHLGRLEGTIVRPYPTGFAMTITATARRRDKLAAQLSWLANRHIFNLAEERKHARRVPRKPWTTIVLPNGAAAACRIVQMSVSGAAVASEHNPPINAAIRLGTVDGRVVRVNDEGFAVEFAYLQDPDFLAQEHERRCESSVRLRTRITIDQGMIATHRAAGQ